ncbi:hypothetical protein [Algicella marina]|uniref:Alpha/beta hydrolase n=1 Tax=Algicella marina TaxID=2683284 RepID=A0A6P1SZY3_9RHOB|nr:hypothetical protein [Algicella marina]QHQ34589.1 hypothetical protein GO499_04975 [Algicella marina]
MAHAQANALPPEAATEASQPQEVRRRHVFYVPGFDPMGARRYRELYRTHSARQAEISGYEIAVSAAPKQAGNYAWSVSSEIEGQKTETIVEFLEWSDLVRQTMNRNTLHALWTWAWTGTWFLWSGAVRAWASLHRKILIPGLYPYLTILAQLLAGLLVGLAAGGLAAAFGLATPAVRAVALVAGVAATAAILRYFRKRDQKHYIYYLLFMLAYAAVRAQKRPKMMLDREDAFARRIAEVLRTGEADEVLVVGHSAGGYVAVPIVAKLVRMPGLPLERLGLLTLAHVIPLTSFLKGAGDMRADLNILSKTPEITWLDVSAPGDGGCFPLSDPVATCGAADDDQIWPKVISAAFSMTLSEEKQDPKTFTFFERHFQYIYAFDYPREYDYFRITAGPMTLRTRFAHRDSTTSRITRVCTPYTDREQ